jgi:hypothetical protein
MGYLSVPYRVVYEGKAFRSGLTNVQAMVVKPNGSLSGPFSLPEMASPFLGRYFFDYLTQTTDPEGEYFAMIISPTEGIQDTLRIPLYNPIQNTGGGGGGSDVLGFIDDAALSGVVDDGGPVVGVLSGDNAFGFVQDQENISGLVEDVPLDGMIQ